MKKGVKVLFGIFSLSVLTFSFQLEKMEKFIPTKNLIKREINISELKVGDCKKLKRKK